MELYEKGDIKRLFELREQHLLIEEQLKELNKSLQAMVIDDNLKKLIEQIDL